MAQTSVVTETCLFSKSLLNQAAKRIVCFLL